MRVEKPNKLKRHLETLHHELANKPLDFFQRKAQEIKSSAEVLHRNVTLNDKAQLASYMVSYHVATEKQPHTIAERLILPAAIDMVSTVIDEQSAGKLKCIPLSNNTVSCKINDISDNLEKQLISRLKAAGDFSIQLDESTDVSDCATLLVYVRYVWENEFVEDLLCYLTIPTGTTGIPLNLDKALKEVIRIVNFIKGSALNNQLFDQLCTNMGAELTHLLFHTEVRWLSKGRNLKWQEQHDNVFRNWKHVLAFQKSLKLWLARLRWPNPSHYMFPTVLEHTENDVTDTGSLLELGLTPAEETELLQLSSDRTLKRRHECKTLSSFWISISSEYAVLSKASILLHIPFTTTCKCEVGFSVLTKMKTKHRNRLNAAPDMRVAH
ncbi:Protein FAM200B [Merluccius polli]|uniref:Protein FAM200B n=1 Tax=Merluccius polli TaxID=89951 RepID=A0AA47MTZ9_MERPO|nr:Protein FAM200B [Merluccius polli]